MSGRGARRALVACAVGSAMVVATGCGLGQSRNGSPESESSPGAAPSAETTTAAPSSSFDLLYVDPQAPPCATVWVAGTQLPEDYEWCVGDDGQPVAGTRIGSCEVVTHRNELYAVPGFQIKVASGSMAQDPGYRAELTSCKRSSKPAN